MANKNFIVKNGVTLEGYGEVIDSAGNWVGVSAGLDSAQVRSLFNATDGISYNSTTGTITHADTSGAPSVDNSGNTFIQDISVDEYGHVTAIGSATAVINDATVTISPGVGLAGGGAFTTNQAGNETITLNVDLNELTTSTTNADGDYFVVVDTSGTTRKLTKANISISQFNNDAGFTTYDSANATGQITTAINNLIDGAPTALDTLNELAAALNDDANFAATVTNQIAALPDSAQVSSIITADVTKTFVDALNVDADTLDGQQGSYYLDYNNFTNTPSVGGGNTTSFGLYEHSNTIDSDYTITSGNNAITAGDITIASGVTVTVPANSQWVLV